MVTNPNSHLSNQPFTGFYKHWEGWVLSYFCQCLADNNYLPAKEFASEDIAGGGGFRFSGHGQGLSDR